VGRFNAMALMKRRTVLVIAAAAGITIIGGWLQARWSEPDLRARRSPGFYFSASRTAAVFPVPRKDGSVALVFFDRTSGPTKLLRSEGSLRAPYLSADGQRLIAVRQRGQKRELLSCTIVNWICRSLLQTENSLDWPVEIREDVVAYSSSPLVPWGDGGTRYASQDIWLWENGSSRQLTELQLYQLSAISFTNKDVFFSAYGSLRTAHLLPKSDPLAKTGSNIFRLPFDPIRIAVVAPANQLQPQLWTDGRSGTASSAPDGERIALLNTNIPSANYRYDVVLVDLKSKQIQRFESAGVSYSRPVIVDHTVLANDILDGQYRINLLDIRTGKQQTIVEIPWGQLADGRTETKGLSVEP
jgi:hypothetical protein